jgi:sulfite reductase (NADPH) flavoprotein alpha-component
VNTTLYRPREILQGYNWNKKINSDQQKKAQQMIQFVRSFSLLQSGIFFNPLPNRSKSFQIKKEIASHKYQHPNKNRPISWYLIFSESFQSEKRARPDASKVYQVRVTENRRLTPLDYERNVFHMELDTTGTGIIFNIIKY